MLTVIGLLSTAFGVSVASALLPLISVELFAIGLVLNGPEIPWWLLAVVIATGQIGGKLLHFYAARGVIRLPKFFRRKNTGEKGGRWREWLERFRANCQRRPVWTGAVLLVSATASLPPFAAVAVIAGWAKVPLSTFVITGFIGRFVRFGALAIAPGVIVAWL
ncbi:membrane protein YqaA, SNARE-associated domain [Saccharopolyspora kobensis]|uniref:Membrane protein YqaA, SNARE-associated domain n=1 Tax=Saccharopolyspora kobensis TaxID=146035 RepID=A0A1H6BWN9_9PSEU|nr:VTT domain-containing protein [Saccharopolyspora kobensis]SEG65083.1 membrane protein YqaA, SNARE-associated domain [Saccharopolyspora kobensis]SFC19043.1 membrane protein YqaA, SNARE-associated domain [Saccharopolyspora kobensis]